VVLLRRRPCLSTARWPLIRSLITAETAASSLPALPWAEWRQTKGTLYLWLQIVGKTKLALSLLRNHWWNVVLYPTVRGLGTRRISPCWALLKDWGRGLAPVG
jgi:hypothetical protein